MCSPADPPFGESRSLSVALSRSAAEGVFRLKKRSTAAAGGYAQYPWRQATRNAAFNPTPTRAPNPNPNP